MKKTIAITSIILSICFLNIGLYIYFFERKKKWIPVNADILRIQIIKKIEDETKIKTITKPSKISVKFSFKVGSINYYPVFNDSLLEFKKTDLRKDLIKNKKMIIYYNIENPNISYNKMPNDGITLIFFSIILLIISLLYLHTLIYCLKK